MPLIVATYVCHAARLQRRTGSARTSLGPINLKYVDDLTVAEVVKMKTQLKSVPIIERPLPDNFHDRTGHVLKPEDSKVYKQLLQTEQYAMENGMRLNYKKTKLILFNPGTSRDFMPKFSIDNNNIDLVEETKLLGVVVRSDLSWSSNTQYIADRANSKLWILRRLKKLGADDDDLKDIYTKQVRSILEFAVPVWHSSLTGLDRLKIERIQKSAMYIILGDKYKSYTSALKCLQLDSLFTRRQKQCKTFARKCSKNVKFEKWFKRNEKKTGTRLVQPRFTNVHCRLVRFERSPISYMTEILNRMKNL